MGTQISDAILKLRQQQIPPTRVAETLSHVAALWENRLQTGWTPPDRSAFPWSQVKLSLAALLPGLRDQKEKVQRQKTEERNPNTSHSRTLGESRRVELERGLPKTQYPKPNTSPPVAALILAGNTPLMSWSPICACLFAGYTVFVKMSRDETLWPRLFVESLAEVDAEVAALVHLDVWPGEDLRTTALVQNVDAVIAFGSDRTMAALREKTPEPTPFFAYGHSISLGLIYELSKVDSEGISRVATPNVMRGFARDILMYEQSGCLSLQTLFVIGEETAKTVSEQLTVALAETADALNVSPVSDPAKAMTIRRAQDLARFSATVVGDAGLRWTVISYPETTPMEWPPGLCVVQVIPIRAASEIPDLLGELRGKISCIAVAGTLPDELQSLFYNEGITRLCQPGEMQTPPLDWQWVELDVRT